MLLSILWTLSREKMLPQRELRPAFQPALCRWLKITITKWENKIVQSENELISWIAELSWYWLRSLQEVMRAEHHLGCLNRDQFIRCSEVRVWLSVKMFAMPRSEHNHLESLFGYKFNPESAESKVANSEATSVFSSPGQLHSQYMEQRAVRRRSLCFPIKSNEGESGTSYW